MENQCLYMIITNVKQFYMEYNTTITTLLIFKTQHLYNTDKMHIYNFLFYYGLYLWGYLMVFTEFSADLILPFHLSTFKLFLGLVLGQSGFIKTEKYFCRYQTVYKHVYKAHFCRDMHKYTESNLLSLKAIISGKRIEFNCFLK